MKVSVIRHKLGDDLGALAPAILRAGGEINYINSYADDLSGFDALAPDLLIVMGGSMGVYQKDDYPYLYDELRILKARIEKDAPTLGICLGAQLMAAALGSDVYIGSAGAEVGWFNLSVNDNGNNSPLRHFKTPVMQWHGDTFDMPKGAVLLASSDKYQSQAFSFGQNIMALQFHPELVPEVIKAWEVGAAKAVLNGSLDLNKLRQDTAHYAPLMMKNTDMFMNDWLLQTGLSNAAMK